MTDATLARRILLVGLVLVCLYALVGCGLTEWQREQDARMEAYRSIVAAYEQLKSADFQREVEAVIPKKLAEQ